MLLAGVAWRSDRTGPARPVTTWEAAMHKRFLAALAVTSVLAGVLPSASSSAQPLAYLTQWGTPGSGDGQFCSPIGVAVGGSGSIYVADQGNHRIQKFGSLSVPAKSTSWGGIKALYR
jgi:hypothetical protein